MSLINKKAAMRTRQPARKNLSPSLPQRRFQFVFVNYYFFSFLAHTHVINKEHLLAPWVDIVIIGYLTHLAGILTHAVFASSYALLIDRLDDNLLPFYVPGPDLVLCHCYLRIIIKKIGFVNTLIKIFTSNHEIP